MTTIAYKGFNKDLTCRGFQYEEGVTYEHDGKVSLCNAGFHAVLLPLDALRYYPLGQSEYRQVTLDDVSDEREADSKVVARKITVGASFGIPGFIRAHVEAVLSRVGEKSDVVKVTTGDSAHAATTGHYAHAVTTGHSAHAVTTGHSAHAVTTGHYAHAATTGDYAHAATTGRYAHAITTGHSATVRAEVKDEGSIAAVLGQGAAAGAVGCWLVLTERDNDWNILNVQSVKVDGKKVKAGTFYELRGGKVTAVKS